MALAQPTRVSDSDEAYESLAKEILILEVRRNRAQAAQVIEDSPVLLNVWRYFFRGLEPAQILGEITKHHPRRIVWEFERAIRIAQEF